MATATATANSGLAVATISSMDATEVMQKIKSIVRAILAGLGTASALGFLRYLVFVIQFKSKQNRKRLPYPPGLTPLPILGSLLSVAKKPGPDGLPVISEVLADIGKQYPGGLYGLWLGSIYTVVVTKPSVAEEMFTDYKLESGGQGHGANCLDRAPYQSKGGHHNPTMRLMTRDGQGIAMSHGAYWRKVRGRMVAGITNPIVAEKNAPMIMEEVNSVCWTWRQKVLRGEPLTDLRAQLKRESMNMGLRLLFSKRFGAVLPEDCQKLQFCVEYFFRNLSQGNASDMIPALRVLPNPFLNEFAEVAKLRDEVVVRMITEHRKEFDELRAQGKMSSRAQARDMCDLFFWDQIEGYDITDENGKTVREKLTEDQLTICIWDVIFASTDTTATTNEFAIYLMITHPEVQKKLHEELDRVVGPDRVPNLDDRTNLPYMWAFLKEVFRFKQISPMFAPHFSIDDMTVHDAFGNEVFIPGGTQLFVHGGSMAMDPELWDEPEKFNPDRWFSKREEGLDLYGQVRRKKTEHYKFMPFSLGPRMCPGYSFAKVAQFLQAATIIHSMEFRIAEGAEKKNPKDFVNGQLDLSFNWGLTLTPIQHGERGSIAANLRPASRLMTPLYNDIDETKVFLEGKTEKKAKLISREQLSSDSALLRFDIGEGAILGLPLGKHIKVHCPNAVGTEPGKWNGRDDPEASHPMVTRAYTPTSSDKDVGYVDLLVKIYAPGVIARFPDGGKVSSQLGKLIVGDEITLSGPWGLIEYLGQSQFKVGRNVITRKFVGMIAGGSGITPMLQILRAALENSNDQTKFSLIYANQTEKDILCKAALEDLQQRYSSKFRLHYTVDRALDVGAWKFSLGFVDAPMISEHMPPKTEDTIIFGCGPPPMLDFVKKNLEKLGFSKEHFAQF